MYESIDADVTCKARSTEHEDGIDGNDPTQPIPTSGNKADICQQRIFIGPVEFIERNQREEKRDTERRLANNNRAQLPWFLHWNGKNTTAGHDCGRREYDKNVRFFQPGDDPKLRGQVDQQATTPQVGSPVLLASLGQPSTTGDQTETNASGIYDALYRDNSGQYHASRFALNVNPLEGNLTIANRQQLLEKLEPVKVELPNPDDYLDTAIQQAGGSASTWLMWVLIFALAGEQLLAFSASYHPAKGGAS